MKKITLDSLDQVGTGNNIVEDLLDQQVREIESILGEKYRGMGNKVLSMFVQGGNNDPVSRHWSISFRKAFEQPLFF